VSFCETCFEVDMLFDRYPSHDTDLVNTGIGKKETPLWNLVPFPIPSIPLSFFHFPPFTLCLFPILVVLILHIPLDGLRERCELHSGLFCDCCPALWCYCFVLAIILLYGFSGANKVMMMMMMEISEMRTATCIHGLAKTVC